MSTHTPGPWSVEDLTETHSKFVMRVVATDVDIDVAELNCEGSDAEAVAATRADGHLIAAAPDLLAELVEARATAIALLGAMPPAVQRKWPNIVARARALGLEEAQSPAIAKAEGRS